MPVLNPASPVGECVYRVDFDPRWAVRSMFGGGVAAVAVNCARRGLDTSLSVSEVMFSYLAPTPSGAAEIRVLPLRVGRRYALADVQVRCEGVLTMVGRVSFAEGAPPAELARADEAPAAGWASLGGDVEWAPSEWGGGRSRSWVRGHGPIAQMAFDEWMCIASDLIGPAVIAADGDPFAVATASLSIVRHGAAAPGEWVRQDVAVSTSGSELAGMLELSAADGRVLARAAQHAVVLPADASELPQCVTAFASSSLGSIMFGMD